MHHRFKELAKFNTPSCKKQKKEKKLFRRQERIEQAQKKKKDKKAVDDELESLSGEIEEFNEKIHYTKHAPFDGNYRIGKTSSGMSVVVMDAQNVQNAEMLVDALESCPHRYICRASLYKGSKILLKEDAQNSLRTLLINRYQKLENSEKKRRSWYGMNAVSFKKLFRSLAKGFMALHDRGLIFGGTFSDVLITVEGPKIAKARKPRSKAEYNSFRMEDVETFFSFVKRAYLMPVANGCLEVEHKLLERPLPGCYGLTEVRDALKRTIVVGRSRRTMSCSGHFPRAHGASGN